MAFEVQGSSAGWLPADVQATFCATLIDQWLLLGLRHAVVCPGSRSTPLAVQLAARVEVDLHIVHDERSAAFVALGIGLATGTPAVALCTSGTAATHFHAAVVEADLSNVAVIVITADRPPELHGVGAPQTIDQTRLFGIAPRWFHDPGVAAAEAKSSWRSVATSAWRAATGAACAPGPVHLNLPFREPLLGVVGELPAAGVDAGLDAAGDAGGERRASITGIAWPTRPTAVAITDLAMQSSGRRGLLIVGRGVDDPAAVHLLARALGWPIVADPRSGCRSLSMAIAAFDSLVRDARFAADHVPELVIRLGEPPASKVLAQWLVATAAVQVQVEATAVT
ncbi:MAG: 2-succinyl-5-enolpyruvyl-6-hydroxy-3-cyclohexene-1-carboxylic-acid synthase, partial [Ilumatobacteraceae bacterium]